MKTCLPRKHPRRSSSAIHLRVGVVLCAWMLTGCDPTVEVADPQETPAAGALRVLPLGNSITQADRDHLSYRYPLWRGLVDDGIAVDFVGSQQRHHRGTPAHPPYADQRFDRDHEGHWGWRVDQILEGEGDEGLEAWLLDYDPDIVLMHLGTNDLFQGHGIESTLVELGEVVRILRSDVSTVTILWALLLPTTNPQSTEQIAELNRAVERLAETLDSDESTIRVVDLNTGFDADALTYDGVHPNRLGEEWMAERWLVAIHEVLASQADEAP